MIVGIIRRKHVLTHASIIFGGMLASVKSVKLGVRFLSERSRVEFPDGSGRLLVGPMHNNSCLLTCTFMDVYNYHFRLQRPINCVVFLNTRQSGVFEKVVIAKFFLRHLYFV